MKKDLKLEVTRYLLIGLSHKEIADKYSSRPSAECLSLLLLESSKSESIEQYIKEEYTEILSNLTNNDYAIFVRKFGKLNPTWDVFI